MTGPLRRKLPLAQPEALKLFAEFNKGKDYRNRAKPFSFLQTVVVSASGDIVRPVAPFDPDLGRSKNLRWIDAKTGKTVQLDWLGSGHAGTVPVMSLAEFVSAYATHAESKAADPNHAPCGRDTRGSLGRLHLSDGEPVRIGKEIDRLYEDEDMTIEDQDPVSYNNPETDAELDAGLEILKQLPQAEAAAGAGITERRYREIEHGRARPHKSTREAIIGFADDVRTGYVTQRERTTSNTAKRPAEQDEGGFPYGAAAVAVFFLICIFAPIFAGRTQQALTLPVQPFAPNEE